MDSEFYVLCLEYTILPSMLNIGHKTYKMKDLETDQIRCGNN